MRLEEAAVPTFARHESFHPRYGWFKRGVDAAGEDPDVFSREAAVVTLGVGKNMVRAIKFWSLAAGVVVPVRNPHRTRVPLFTPSAFGAALLGDEGLDPFCEDPATLWALHWKLLSPKSRVPVWWVVLNEFPGVAFSHSDLDGFVVDYMNRLRQWDKPLEASVRKDVAVFLRMYTAATNGPRASSEDSIDCPFRHLGLIRSDSGSFRFNLGEKPGLAPDIVLFACLDYVARTDPGARTVTLNRLAAEPGAPGRAFKLTEDVLEALLAQANSGIARLEQVSGVAQLTWAQDPGAQARTALWNHYSKGHGAPLPPWATGGWPADEPATDVIAKVDAA